MLQSHVIDIDGNFVGAAVRLDSGYRFVALNIRVEELDGTIWPTLDTVRRLARQLFIAGHFGNHPPHMAVTSRSVLDAVPGV
jgi:hypothetical protein